MLNKNGLIVLREGCTYKKNEIIKNGTYYRPISFYYDIKGIRMIENWTNDCSKFCYTYNKLKKIKIEKMLWILKPILEIRLRILDIIGGKITFHQYYIFQLKKD